MRRALLIFAGLCAVTVLRFQVFPGHTYLQGASQVYVPILERLNSPGLLSRDLVASNPNFTYTIYDEATLFLQDALKMDLHTALMLQQALSEAAAVLGIFLLLRSTGLSDALCLIGAAILNLGAMLPGPQVMLFDTEPTPHGFALGLTFLALGLLATGMPLLAGFAGGLALVYDPRVAGPFWIMVLVALLSSRKLRPMLRPSVTILAVFALLLANLSQLQPGIPDSHQFFEKIPAAIARIQRFRTSFVYVSSWAGLMWPYVAFCLGGWWATARIWSRLNTQVRWMLVMLPALGVAGVPLSYLLLEAADWRLIPQVQPAGTLVFTVALASVAFAIAGLHAFTQRKWSQVVPCLLAVLLLPFVLPRPPRYANEKEIMQLADWAQQTTWGGSMFLFPDASFELYPGIFRALSSRAVWVDWATGRQVASSDVFADEWFRRWQDTMETRFNGAKLRQFLLLPIDYFVLKRENALRNAHPAFATAHFVVYDASELRNSPVALTSQAQPAGAKRADLSRVSSALPSSSGDAVPRTRRRPL